MNPQLVKQLVALNQAFYSRFANEFSETRSSAQMRLNRIVKYVSDGAAVLEVGCGNGRLAERLDRDARPLTYVGVDAAREMVEIANARRAHLHFVRAEFRVADITEPGWNRDLGHAPFDIVIALAVLHHIPSVELRQAVLRDIYAVLKPGGTFVMTNWQFMNNDRMRKKIEEWGTLGIDERELETGDALLRWKRGGTAYRYCHWLSRSEVEELAAQSGFQVVRQFFADADLNLYSVLKGL
ncbi:MAG: class I SAM-dependent methyltransferase [Chloroflexi bacterium]|nr:class I SAM-dependent methyltransferase [Chloroflexota bacterium]